MSAGAIPFVRDLEVVYGRADQVSPLIRRVIAQNPGPFTYTGTGTYLVGRGEVAVIDPGPADEAHLAALLAAIGGDRVSHILITHSHLDHSPLARPLQLATGAPILGRAAQAAHRPFGGAGEEGDDAPDLRGDLIRAPVGDLQVADKGDRAHAQERLRSACSGPPTS